MLKVLYRISDNSRSFDKNREKHKIQNATKINALKCVIEHFGLADLYVFADNCDDKTVEKIKLLGVTPHLLSLGNSASLRYIIDYALENFSDTDLVYLLEDDYWHLPKSKDVLLEGLQIADYVTLYDNPDKFTSFRDGGFNPYITDKSEYSKIYLTHSSHWKTTNSTSMTFATRVSILRKDAGVFKRFTTTKIPNDFAIFIILTQQPLWPILLKLKSIKLFFTTLFFRLSLRPRRKLVSPIPGFSTHLEIDYLSPLIDWQKKIDESS